MLESTARPMALIVLAAATAVCCAVEDEGYAPLAAARGGGEGRADGWLDEPGHAYEMPPACAPGDQAPCPDDLFVCVDHGDGTKRCEGQMPAVPDDGSWECEVTGTTRLCRGDHMPSEASPWLCDDRAPRHVLCRAHAYVPAGGEGGTWECAFVEEFLSCLWSVGPEGGEEEVDDEPVDGCACVPGATRYCDTPTYCQWGVQSCAATGTRWRACRETSPPAECRAVAAWYSPEAEECCIRAGHCCQDMWDLDMDGDVWESLGACADVACGS